MKEQLEKHYRSLSLLEGGGRAHYNLPKKFERNHQKLVARSVKSRRVSETWKFIKTKWVFYYRTTEKTLFDEK